MQQEQQMNSQPQRRVGLAKSLVLTGCPKYVGGIQLKYMEQSKARECTKNNIKRAASALICIYQAIGECSG